MWQFWGLYHNVRWLNNSQQKREGGFKIEVRVKVFIAYYNSTKVNELEKTYVVNIKVEKSIAWKSNFIEDNWTYND